MHKGRGGGASDHKDNHDQDYWVQKLIAGGLSMGIGKYELFHHYYLEEIGEIIHEYNMLNGYEKGRQEKEVYSSEFFGF